MSILSILEWIESTDLSTTIREGALPYPIIGGFHLLGIAFFGGMVLATDLRLLGWAMQRRLVSDIVEQTRPWKRIGFVLVVATGLLLAWAEPQKLYRSPSFWIKMALLILVGDDSEHRQRRAQLVAPQRTQRRAHGHAQELHAWLPIDTLLRAAACRASDTISPSRKVSTRCA